MVHETHYLSDTTQSMYRTAILLRILNEQLKTSMSIHVAQVQ